MPTSPSSTYDVLPVHVAAGFVVLFSSILFSIYFETLKMIPKEIQLKTKDVPPILSMGSANPTPAALNNLRRGIFDRFSG